MVLVDSDTICLIHNAIVYDWSSDFSIYVKIDQNKLEMANSRWFNNLRKIKRRVVKGKERREVMQRKDEKETTMIAIHNENTTTLIFANHCNHHNCSLSSLLWCSLSSASETVRKWCYDGKGRTKIVIDILRKYVCHNRGGIHLQIPNILFE